MKLNYGRHHVCHHRILYPLANLHFLLCGSTAFYLSVMADVHVWVVLNQLDSVGDKKKFKRLRSNLLAIKDVILDAEKRQYGHPAVRKWMDEVKDICSDITDFLDEWNAAILKSENEDEAASEPRRKVYSFVPSCFSSHEFGLLHDNVASKMREIDERLNAIARIKNYFDFALLKDVEHVRRSRVDASFFHVMPVKGREADKNKLKGMLLGESSKQSRPQIISVVGMAGLGKTTLAQLVFNDNEVETHFEKRIWVCVSYYFDPKRIALEILESLGCETPHELTNADIEKRVLENINTKKFLLVLDDVWEEDRSNWSKLDLCLGRGLTGSKILVKTRKESVAITMRSGVVLKLGMMSTEECWSIFSEIAFFGRSRGDCEHLQGVGRKIIDKCTGLPLVAEALGRLLRYTELKEDWQRVLDREVWELEDVKRAILAPLQLEYNDLPSAALRLCFSFCAIFPKDSMIEKRHLIELWIAQGYLEKTYSKSVNEVGERYFQVLVARSFFQDCIIDKADGSIISYKMHDMVLDFARYLTKDKCISIEINNPEELRVNSFHGKVRHAMVVLQKSVTIPNSFYHMKKLHSLFIHSKGNLRIEAALPDLFNQLTYLRSLNLGHCGIKEIPLNINKLVHLRQLDLSLNKNLKELPETICELGNLQILDVSYCDKLVLPREIEKLINLSHLHNFESNNPLPEGIQRLRSLEILDNFVVGKEYGAAKLKDLGNLNTLGSSFCTTGWFCISGLENVFNVNDLKRAQLEGKMDLSALKLDFGGGRAEWRKSHDGELVEALEEIEIIRSIVGLWLLDCQATRIFPTRIIEAYKLRTLRLTNCINCKILPSLGRLPFLEFLHLWGMPGVKRVGVEFLGISSVFTVAFPKLTKLYFVNMGNWEDWIDGYSNKTTSIMPLLQHLCLSHCPKLKALSVYILQKTTLEKLDISRGCLILEKRYEKGIGKDWHKISHIPNINISHTIF